MGRKNILISVLLPVDLIPFNFVGVIIITRIVAADTVRTVQITVRTADYTVYYTPTR